MKKRKEGNLSFTNCILSGNLSTVAILYIEVFISSSKWKVINSPTIATTFRNHWNIYNFVSKFKINKFYILSVDTLMDLKCLQIIIKKTIKIQSLIYNRNREYEKIKDQRIIWWLRFDIETFGIELDIIIESKY